MPELTDQEAAALNHLQEAMVERLARFSPLEYDKCRRAEAKTLGVMVATLDAEVKKARAEHQAKNPEPKKAPEWAPLTQTHTEPVNGEELMAELIGAIRRFVMLDESAALTVALWVLFTWVFEQIAETNPYLRIVAPAPECGKSTLLKVVKFLCRGAWLVSRITASSFTRTMERERRTLLLDEGAAFLHENEIMRNVLDSASDPDTANVSMAVKSGDDWIPADFNTYVPIAIVSIGTLRKMQTVESRGIHAHLKRATPAELKQLSKGRRREMRNLLDPLAAKCARWAVDNAPAMKGVRPELPEGLSGREQDKWEPLIMIADKIGGAYAQLSRATASTTSDSRQSTSLSELMLADLMELFDVRNATALASADICTALIEREDRPWGEMGRARKPLTQRGLAGLLRGFEIVPGTVHPEGNPVGSKGYKRSDLEDSFSRYLHISGDPIRPNVQTLGGQGESDDFTSVQQGSSDGSENSPKPNGQNELDAWTDENPENVDREDF